MKKNTNKIKIYIFLIVMAIVFLIPIYSVIMNSFKNVTDIFNNTWGLPTVWRFSNYSDVWLGRTLGSEDAQPIIGGMRPYFINSMKVTLSAVAIQMILSFLLAFPLAKFKFRYNNLILGLTLFGIAMPYQILIIPIFKGLDSVGLLNTVPGLVFV